MDILIFYFLVIRSHITSNYIIYIPIAHYDIYNLQKQFLLFIQLLLVFKLSRPPLLYDPLHLHIIHYIIQRETFEQKKYFYMHEKLKYCQFLNPTYMLENICIHPPPHNKKYRSKTKKGRNLIKRLKRRVDFRTENQNGNFKYKPSYRYIS